MKRLKYWAGGTSCFLSLLSLSLGLAPMVRMARNKVPILQFPGENVVTLGKEESYMGVALVGMLKPAALSRIYDLIYFIENKNSGELVQVNKMPAQPYYTEKQQDQSALIAFTTDEPGEYLISANYPYELDGPHVQVAIFNMNVTQARVELYVGLTLFVLFGAGGIYLILKARKETAGQSS